MKMFITGATGFIGRHLIRRLAGSDHQLSCLVRPTSETDAIEKYGVTLIRGDVTDRASLEIGIAGHDLIINLANVYSFWEPNRKVYREVNVDGTKNVMEAALDNGVTKFIHISTAGIYGKPADRPFTEESPVGPVRSSEYFESKYEGDQIAWQYYRTRGLPLVMIYPCAVLGPDDPKATGQYIQRLLNRTLPARVFEGAVMTFVHVRDVVEAIVRVAEAGNGFGEKYLVGKYRLTFGDINRLVNEISGVPLPKLRLPDWLVMVNASILTGIANIIKKPPPWNMAIDQMTTMKQGFAVDGSKAERELGITYTPIETALREAIESYQP